MVVVRLTPNLARQTDAHSCEVQGASVREALEAVFEKMPGLRGYILDDQQAVRKHVAVFVDGDLIVDRMQLSDSIGPDSEIFVMQALSGG